MPSFVRRRQLSLALAQDANDAPWSICGEPVATARSHGVARFRPGSPTDVNDRDNWAARGTLLFEPTLDTSLLLGAHGARRDELTRLGQSIGTSGVVLH